MKRGFILPIILLSILLLAEIGSFLIAKAYIANSTNISVKKFIWIWWISTLSVYILSFSSRLFDSNLTKNIIVNIFMALIILKLFVTLVFLLFTLFNFLRSLIFSLPNEKASEILNSRRDFVSKIALSSALIPFVTLSYGIAKTAYDFKIHKLKFKSPKIPKSFKGFKIVQISDIHTGGLQGNYQLQKAINLVMAQKPDMIVFTGDLVNNRTDEAFEYAPILSQLNAPYGVFSTLGNHDYGDYASWNSEAEKDKNMQDMIDFHEKIGWNLMLNNHVKIEKENEFFSLIGIENWGGNYNFKKYGDLHKAYENIDKSSFQVLLSHDPSHWNLQVTTDFPEIDLTLAGHTHGFQFGIEIPGFKWSPSKYIYPQWAGIYGTGKQKLYVNRGLGCLGYMGRVGIKPEITVIELD